MKHDLLAKAAASVVPLMAASSASAVVHTGTGSLTMGAFDQNGGYWDVEASTMTGSTPALGADVQFSLGTVDTYGMAIRSLNNSFKFVAAGGKVLGLAVSSRVALGHGFDAVTGTLINHNGSLVNGSNLNTSGNSYIGFTFKNSSNVICYGWAQITMGVHDLSGSMAPYLSINSWAYDDSGMDIFAGTSMTTSVPEPAETVAGLGALALGAAGLRRWRKNKVAKAA